MKLSVVREHVETLRKRTTYRKVIDAEKGNRAPFGTHIGSIVRWILRLRKELASLAAAVESSGVVCPDCHGTKRDLFAVKPCPRCSVPAGAWVECETCNGRGSVAADNPADHAMFDPDGTDYAVYARAGGRTPCPDCKGLGHRPGQIREVALGKVYPRKDDPK